MKKVIILLRYFVLRNLSFTSTSKIQKNHVTNLLGDKAIRIVDIFVLQGRNCSDFTGLMLTKIAMHNQVVLLGSYLQLTLLLLVVQLKAPKNIGSFTPPERV